MKTMELMEMIVNPISKEKIKKESNANPHLDSLKIPTYDFTFLTKSKNLRAKFKSKKIFGLHLDLFFLCIICAVFSGSCYYIFLYYFNPFVGINPLISSNWRFQIAVLTLFPFAFFEFRANRALINTKMNINNILTIWTISINQTIYSTLYSSSYFMTTFAHSGILSSTSVFVTFCFNRYFLLTQRNYFAGFSTFIIIISGIIMLLLSTHDRNSISVFGDFSAVLASIFHSIYFILLKYILFEIPLFCLLFLISFLSFINIFLFGLFENIFSINLFTEDNSLFGWTTHNILICLLLFGLIKAFCQTTAYAIILKQYQTSFVTSLKMVEASLSILICTYSFENFFIKIGEYICFILIIAGTYIALKNDNGGI